MWESILRINVKEGKKKRAFESKFVYPNPQFALSLFAQLGCEQREMNPLTLVKRTQNINAREAALGIGEEASWHAKYRDSAYIFVGGIPFDLTEGDLLAVFAQYFSSLFHFNSSTLFILLTFFF